MAKKRVSVPAAIVKMIDKAKQEVLICFSGSVADWQQESVISAITRALGRGVGFWVLVGPMIDSEPNPVYQYLKLKVSPGNVGVYMAPTELIVFFVLVDKKDFIFENLPPRLGDRLSGNYLRGKFTDAITRSKPINPQETNKR